jgi:hypothetical protein
MIILRRKLILTEEHKKTVSLLEDTHLDYVITNLWSKFRPAKVYIDNRDVSHEWDLWRNLNLKIGQEIIIEVRR